MEWSIEDQLEAWETYGPPVDGIHPKDPQLRRALEVLQQQIKQNLGAFPISRLREDGVTLCSRLAN